MFLLHINYQDSYFIEFIQEWMKYMSKYTSILCKKECKDSILKLNLKIEDNIYFYENESQIINDFQFKHIKYIILSKIYTSFWTKINLLTRVIIDFSESSYIFKEIDNQAVFKTSNTSVM